MLNTNQIHQLLEKYFAGETSLEEENLLHQYFNQEEVAESLQTYQPLFQFFKMEKEVQMENQISSTDFQGKPVRSNRMAKIRPLYRPIISIAAALLLAILAYWNFSSSDTTETAQAINWEQYEITDEKEAMEKTLAALELLSKKFNRGSKKVSKGVKKIKTVNVFGAK